jgi:hypothetical protein
MTMTQFVTRTILTVALACAGLELGIGAQPPKDSERPGTVVFDGSRTKPFVKRPNQFYYFPAAELKGFLDLAGFPSRE